MEHVSKHSQCRIGADEIPHLWFGCFSGGIGKRKLHFDREVCSNSLSVALQRKLFELLTGRPIHVLNNDRRVFRLHRFDLFAVLPRRECSDERVFG